MKNIFTFLLLVGCWVMLPYDIQAQEPTDEAPDAEAPADSSQNDYQDWQATTFFGGTLLPNDSLFLSDGPQIGVRQTVGLGPGLNLEASFGVAFLADSLERSSTLNSLDAALMFDLLGAEEGLGFFFKGGFGLAWYRQQTVRETSGYFHFGTGFRTRISEQVGTRVDLQAIRFLSFRNVEALTVGVNWGVVLYF